MTRDFDQNFTWETHFRYFVLQWFRNIKYGSFGRGQYSNFKSNHNWLKGDEY